MLILTKCIMVTHVDQTWNSLFEGLMRIEAAVDELITEEF